MSVTGNGGSAELHDERALTSSRVNIDRLEAELGRAPSPPTSSDNFAKRAQTGATSKHSPLQTIADAIKRLIWDDNEKLGQLIAEHYANDGNSKGSMAAAVQRAADDLLAAAKDQ
jgi:hypothetical protein